MEYSKQTVIEGLKRTIEQTEARPEERDLLKKKVKNWKKRIKELEDET